MKNNIYAPPDSILKPTYGKTSFRERAEMNRKYVREIIQYAEQYGKGKYKGKTVSFPMGDGYALYIIFDKKSLIHVDTGDAWHVPLAEYMPMKDMEKIAREYFF